MDRHNVIAVGFDRHRRPDHRDRLDRPGAGRGARPPRKRCRRSPSSRTRRNTITRTLFVSLAMIELTAIYCFVVAMILLFANPFWNAVSQKAGG